MTPCGVAVSYTPTASYARICFCGSAITWNFCEILHIYVIILATLKCQLAFIIGIYYTAR